MMLGHPVKVATNAEIVHVECPHCHSRLHVPSATSGDCQCLGCTEVFQLQPHPWNCGWTAILIDSCTEQSGCDDEH